MTHAYLVKRYKKFAYKSTVIRSYILLYFLIDGKYVAEVEPELSVRS